MAIYLIYSLVNSIFGIDFRRSLWGFVDRQDGLVLWLHFFAWFAVVVWFYSTTQTRFSAEPHGHTVKDRAPTPVLKERGIFSYVRFSFWVSFAVALTALMEWISVRLPR